MLKPRPGPAASPPVMPYIGEAGVRPYQDAAAIAADPAYGQIVCHCERVTRGEIRDALASPVPPADLDGLRRRTRAGNGRCQGFYCGAAVSRLLAEGRAEPGRSRSRRAVTGGVVVVGAGPAGLSAAVELRRLGAGPVLVADRESAPGGVPRHSWHTGYGLRDLHRVMTGPAYARALVSAALSAGADLRAGTTVTGWTPGPDGSHAVTMTSPAGRRDGAGGGGAAGHRVPGAAADGAAGPRRPPGRGDDHRRAAAAGVPGRGAAGRAGAGGRGRARVVLGRADARARRGQRGRAGHRARAAAELRRVPVRRGGALAGAGVDLRARCGGSPGGDGWRASRWRTCGPGRRGSCRASSWSSPATGFPTTSWPGWPAWPWTPAPAARRSTRRWRRRPPGVFAAGNLVHAAETADIAALSGRHAARHIAAFLGGEARRPDRARPDRARRRPEPGFRCSWSRRCGGSRPTRSGPPPLPRSAGSCCAAPSSAGAFGWRSGRTAGCWPGPARPGSSRNGRCTSARPGWTGSTRRAARCASSPAPRSRHRPLDVVTGTWMTPGSPAPISGLDRPSRVRRDRPEPLRARTSRARSRST